METHKELLDYLRKAYDPNITWEQLIQAYMNDDLVLQKKQKSEDFRLSITETKIEK